MIATIFLPYLMLNQGSLCGYIDVARGPIKLKDSTGITVVTAVNRGKPIFYGDFVKIGPAGLLVLKRRSSDPIMFRESSRWQTVLPQKSVLRSQMDEAMSKIAASMASKGDIDVVASPTVHLLTLYLPDESNGLQIELRQLGQVLWKGKLSRDAWGFHSNVQIGMALANSSRTSPVLLAFGERTVEFRLMESGQEAVLLDALTRADLNADADQRAWARIDAYKAAGLDAMAAREALRLKVF